MLLSSRMPKHFQSPGFLLTPAVRTETKLKSWTPLFFAIALHTMKTFSFLVIILSILAPAYRASPITSRKVDGTVPAASTLERRGDRSSHALVPKQNGAVQESRPIVARHPPADDWHPLPVYDPILPPEYSDNSASYTHNSSARPMISTIPSGAWPSHKFTLSSEHHFPSAMPNNIICYFGADFTDYEKEFDHERHTLVHKFRTGRAADNNLRPDGLVCTSTAEIVPFDSKLNMEMCVLTTSFANFRKMTREYKNEELDFETDDEDVITFNTGAMHIPNPMLLTDALEFNAYCFPKTQSLQIHSTKESVIPWYTWGILNWPKDSDGQPVRFELKSADSNKKHWLKDWLTNLARTNAKTATVKERLRSQMVLTVRSDGKMQSSTYKTFLGRLQSLRAQQ
ncbi:hypothetical protein EV361DRAFT_940297 [Lentinula raphanica]|nr:hypothetical protein EV361DRAFT_940297 [Lentinula raphanica]